MSHEPATPHKYAALSLEQMIGLFLAKLYGWLIRCQASGAPFAPADIAENVNKADALVHAFIRSRAAAQLEHAGYLDAARAMRDFGYCSRDASHRIELAQGCHTELSSGTHEQAALSAHCANEKFASANENASGAAGPTSVGAPASTTRDPAELLARLETIIEQFEQAEAIGSTLAGIILCTLAFLTPETRETAEYEPLLLSQINRTGRVSLGPPKITPAGRGPPYSWPPPTQTAIHSWDHEQREGAGDLNSAAGGNITEQNHIEQP